MPLIANVAPQFHLLLALAVSIGFVPAAARAQCPEVGVIGFDGLVASAKGKPFQARAVYTIVTYRSDSTKSVMVIKSNIFRDAEGRVRIERFYDGSDHPLDSNPSQVMIFDNCGTTYNLAPDSHTIKVFKHHSVPNSPHAYCQLLDLNHLPDPGPKGTFEILPPKTIDGVKAQGERTTIYSSVEAKLSGAPPVGIQEFWCSPELETPMGSLSFSLLDQPKRELTIEISDIRRIEPAPDLFEIPKDYTIARPSPSSPPQPAPAKPAP
jgi:hypothetical protein